MREANFTEVEVGLQSVEPDAMALMDRKNNLRAFERGVRAMTQEGIRVKADLIVGLPGDTVASVRRGLHFLHDNGLADDVQVFNLAVLPGTAFREDAARLGLIYQSRPPYYVLKTPALDRTDLFGLMQEAQELFGIEFDAQPPPVLDFRDEKSQVWRVDLDRSDRPGPPPAPDRAQAFTLWLRSARFGRHINEAADLVRGLLRDSPFTTLQVVLESAAEGREAVEQDLGPDLLGKLMAVCQECPTYLDKFYALQPGSANGAKRLVVVLPLGLRQEVSAAWLEAVSETATVVARTSRGQVSDKEKLECLWF
jgi:hypothetical protein